MALKIVWSKRASSKFDQKIVQLIQGGVKNPRNSVLAKFNHSGAGGHDRNATQLYQEITVMKLDYWKRIIFKRWV